LWATVTVARKDGLIVEWDYVDEIFAATLRGGGGGG
jgi:hypothetical protein